MKQCKRCLNSKSLSEFTNDRSAKDGRDKHCRNCKRIIQKIIKTRYETNYDLVDYTKIKQCRSCENSMTLKYFYKNRSKKDGFHDECAKCQRKTNLTKYYANRSSHLEKMKDRYQKNKGIISDKLKQSRKHNPDIFKNRKLKDEFGIGLIDYRSLSEQQNHVCAICGNKETIVDKRTGKTRALAVDHCHKTKRTRGLLCMACNQGIGNLKESPHIIQSALNYLQKHKEEQCHKT